MKRIALVVAVFAVAAGFADLQFADLKVGTTYTIGAAELADLTVGTRRTRQSDVRARSPFSPLS